MTRSLMEPAANARASGEGKPNAPLRGGEEEARRRGVQGGNAPETIKLWACVVVATLAHREEGRRTIKKVREGGGKAKKMGPLEEGKSSTQILVDKKARWTTSTGHSMYKDMIEHVPRKERGGRMGEKLAMLNGRCRYKVKIVVFYLFCGGI